MRSIFRAALLAAACMMPAIDESEPGPSASLDPEPGDPPLATHVTPPEPTTGVAGSAVPGPKDAGSLNPANVPGAKLADEVKWVWARFKQMAHIPPGRTVYPGQVVQVDAAHLHPDLHEELADDDPAIPGNTDAPAAVTRDSPDLGPAVSHLDDADLVAHLDEQDRRVKSLEERVADLEAWRGPSTPPVPEKFEGGPQHTSSPPSEPIPT